MLDFTSSLYLGMRHPSQVLRPWAQLTTGIPATLGLPPGAETVAAALARLQGCERATLARSTLHAFCDLFEVIAGDGTGILVDAGAYPIARWGMSRAVTAGVPAQTFAHHDPRDLRRRLGQPRWGSLRPLVVVDGLCTGCGQVAPFRAYLDVIRPRGGLLIIDDTQALGILGAGPSRREPLGRGGGGSLPWAGVFGPDVVVVSSLAKGFGVPVAVVAGSGGVIAGLEEEGPSRVHCSPPSRPDVHAAEHALTQNARGGDDRRARLQALVQRFRTGLGGLGLIAAGGWFPIQTLPAMDEPAARRLHRGLLLRGVRTVLTRPRCGPGAAVTFIITAGHRPAEIDAALGAVARALVSGSEERTRHATG